MGSLFAYIALILEFWRELRFILDLLKKTPQDKRREVISKILNASKEADKSGDTSGYEDLIKKG